jgi:hypothetical protein
MLSTVSPQAKASIGKRGFRVCEQSVYGGDSKELNTPGYVHKLCQRVRSHFIKINIQILFHSLCDWFRRSRGMTSVAINSNRSSLVTKDSKMSLRML